MPRFTIRFEMSDAMMSRAVPSACQRSALALAVASAFRALHRHPRQQGLSSLGGLTRQTDGQGEHIGIKLT